MDFQEYYEAAVGPGWFDPCFYFDLLQSEGVSLSDGDLSLFEHYAGIGWKRGLSPSARFSVGRYLSRYPDVAESRVDPLYHYLARGRKERREAFARSEAAGVQFVGLIEWRADRRGAANTGQPRSNTIARQLALARAHGVSAFCIHHDRSRGRQVLDDIGAETPFCLMFDRRTWDHRRKDAGAAAEAQRALVGDVLETMADPRYLRVLGNPLLVVYRPELLQDGPAIFAHWREAARRAGLPGLFLAGLPFQAGGPPAFGLDGLIDAPVVPGPGPSGKERRSDGRLEEGAEMAVFPGFMPDRDLSTWRGWGDNAPEFFRVWLASAAWQAASLARRDLPQLAFIDARNGWADGTKEFLDHADPSAERDHPALAKLRRFAEAILVTPRLPVLFLCDAAARAQAERLTASAQWRRGLDSFLLLDGEAQPIEPGGRTSSFALCDMDGLGWSRERTVEHLARLLRARGDLVVVSAGLATAGLLAPLATQGHGIACLVPEPVLAAGPAGGAAFASQVRNVHRIVASSEQVRERIVAAGAVARDDIQVLPPPAEAGASGAWAQYVGDIRECLTGLGNEGRRVRLTGATLGRQAVAADLCVVIPSYNHRRFLLSAVDSILAQSVRPGEIRIIDDGSGDGSAELVQSLASEEIGIIVEARENRGAHATINQAIAATACPIVAVMNSDDRWHPLRIEQLIGRLRGRDGVDVAFSRLGFFGPEARCEEKRRWYEGGIADYRNGSPLWQALAFCNFLFTTSNLIMRRDRFIELGGLAPLRYCHDLDYILKAILAGHRVEFVEQTLCDYRIHDSNTIDEDVRKVVIEEAWIVVKILRGNFGQLREVEKLKLAQRICDKGLATRVLAILRAAVREGVPLDDRLVHREPRLGAGRDEDEPVRSEAERREFLHEIVQLVLALDPGAASVASVNRASSATNSG